MKQVIALEHRALRIVDEICDLVAASGLVEVQLALRAARIYTCLTDAFGRVGRKEDASKTNEKLTFILCRSGVAEEMLKNVESAAALQQERDGKFLPSASYIESQAMMLRKVEKTGNVPEQIKLHQELAMMKLGTVAEDGGRGSAEWANRVAVMEEAIMHFDTAILLSESAKCAEAERTRLRLHLHSAVWKHRVARDFLETVLAGWEQYGDVVEEEGGPSAFPLQTFVAMRDKMSNGALYSLAHHLSLLVDLRKKKAMAMCSACGQCKGDDTPMLVCSGCRVARFCDATHQKEAHSKFFGLTVDCHGYGGHKHVCALLKKWRQVEEGKLSAQECHGEMTAFLDKWTARHGDGSTTLRNREGERLHSEKQTSGVGWAHAWARA